MEKASEISLHKFAGTMLAVLALGFPDRASIHKDGVSSSAAEATRDAYEFDSGNGIVIRVIIETDPVSDPALVKYIDEATQFKTGDHSPLPSTPKLVQEDGWKSDGGIA